MVRSAAFWKIPILFLVVSSCYPVEDRRLVQPEEFRNTRSVDTPTKVHLTDGSVILFQSGFRMSGDSIFAEGNRYYFPGVERYVGGQWTVPLDSVTGLEYFDMTISGGRAPGALLLGASQTSAAGLGSLFLLKAIFGSCPTVYSVADTVEHLEAEAFSYSIGRQFETDDLDRLTAPQEKDGIVALRIRNEALETHYIDQFGLLYADHPDGSEIFPADESSAIVVHDLFPPVSAFNSEGRQVLRELRERDSLTYSLDSASVMEMFVQRRRDWIECVVPLPPDADELTIALRARNSLQNTILLYDVMMANQGLQVLEWSRQINESPLYAWNLWSWYREISGVEVFVEENGQFEHKGRLEDTGPIAWKLMASQLELDGHRRSVRVRLVFLPDSWTIDWVGFSAHASMTADLSVATCIDAKHSLRGKHSDARQALHDDDEEYQVTYPGEEVDLRYRVPPRRSGMQRTYFVQSNGFYVEWVRPQWVRERPDVPGFDVTNEDRIMEELTHRWLLAKNRFEDDFYAMRIPPARPRVMP